MNMIINVGPVLIGAYEKSVRAGKYGYDGWLGCGRAGCVLGSGALLPLSVVTVSTVHTAITRWSQHSACHARQPPDPPRSCEINAWDSCTLAGRAIWQLHHSLHCSLSCWSLPTLRRWWPRWSSTGPLLSCLKHHLEIEISSDPTQETLRLD